VEQGQTGQKEIISPAELHTPGEKQVAFPLVFLFKK
jgi:hypothetical protein